jgi:hypothetical protein
MESNPDWLPVETFEEFLKMRKKIKKPMTDYAVQLAIRTLDRLRQEGSDPKDVLEQSIMNSWQGLFPCKAQKQNQPPTFKGVK